MTLKCEFCNKDFSKVSNLNIHQKNTKYCLEIQAKINASNGEVITEKCEFCNKEFNLKSSKLRHEKTCKVKHKPDFEKLYFSTFAELEKVSKNFQQSSEQFSQYKALIDEKIIRINSENFSLINELNIKDGIIADLRLQLSKKEKIMTSITKKAIAKPTTSIVKNKIIQNLQPITDEHLKACSSNLTIDHIKKGAVGYAQYAIEYPLKDKVIVSDYARRIMKYKNENQEIVSDPELTKLLPKVLEPLDESTRELVKDYIDEILRKVGGYKEIIESDLAANETISLHNTISELSKIINSGEETEFKKKFVNHIFSMVQQVVKN